MVRECRHRQEHLRFVLLIRIQEVLAALAGPKTDLPTREDEVGDALIDARGLTGDAQVAHRMDAPTTALRAALEEEHQIGRPR
jgi:hypothetical protein